MPTEVNAHLDANFISTLTEGLTAAKEPLPAGAIPDGQYTAKIVAVTPGTSKKGTPYIRFDLEILGPHDEYVGANVSSFQNLGSSGNYEMFKKTLRRLGIQSNDGNTILAELGNLVDSVWNITAKVNHGFSNYYFNRSVVVES